MDLSGPKGSEWTKQTEVRPNGPKWSKWTRMNRVGFEVFSYMEEYDVQQPVGDC